MVEDLVCDFMTNLVLLRPLQGYLAHKKMPLPRPLPQAFA